MTLFFTTAARPFDKDLVGVLLIVFLLILVVLMCSVPWMVWFKQELKYINTEIKRTEGREQARWKRRKKRLLKSLLPWVKYE